jgi:hypothetical protein
VARTVRGARCAVAAFVPRLRAAGAAASGVGAVPVPPPFVPRPWAAGAAAVKGARTRSVRAGWVLNAARTPGRAGVPGSSAGLWHAACGRHEWTCSSHRQVVRLAAATGRLRRGHERTSYALCREAAAALRPARSGAEMSAAPAARYVPPPFVPQRQVAAPAAVRRVATTSVRAASVRNAATSPGPATLARLPQAASVGHERTRSGLRQGARMGRAAGVARTDVVRAGRGAPEATLPQARPTGPRPTAPRPTAPRPTQPLPRSARPRTRLDPSLGPAVASFSAPGCLDISGCRRGRRAAGMVRGSVVRRS